MHIVYALGVLRLCTEPRAFVESMIGMNRDTDLQKRVFTCHVPRAVFSLKDGSMILVCLTSFRTWHFRRGTTQNALKPAFESWAKEEFQKISAIEYVRMLTLRSRNLSRLRLASVKP